MNAGIVAFIQHLPSVDPLRIALRFPACGAGVFLLDDEPILSLVHSVPTCILARLSFCKFSSHELKSVPGVGIEPTAS